MSDRFLSSDDFDEKAHSLYNEGRYDDALAVLNEGLLHRMQFRTDSQPLNSHNVGAVEFAGEHQAGIDRLAIQKDGAGATIAGTATFFGAGHADLIAQQIEKQAVRRDFTAD